MLETIMVNPNSYLNLQTIMEDIHKNVIVSGKKKWFFLGADGPPYTLMRRLIKEKKFDWVSITSGLGHLNMNQLKTFFAVLDGVCFDVLAGDVLNFKSKKAYAYFLACKDTHKSWESFEIFLHGTVMEMIRLYYSETTDHVPSPIGFLKWQRSVTNPTLRFLFELVLNFGLGIYIQRIGDRCNDAKTSQAGRMKFLDMFYAFNHPIYREVEYNELRTKVICPDPVKNARNRNLTYTESSGLEKNHQGGDFMLEQRVKRMKMVSPKGVMSKTMWQRVARNIDNVDEIVSNGMSLLQMKECDQYCVRFTPVEKEIVKWRAALRHAEYLNTKSDMILNIHGELLNDELVNFSEVLKLKRELYFDLAKTKVLQNIRTRM